MECASDCLMRKAWRGRCTLHAIGSQTLTNRGLPFSWLIASTLAASL